MWNYKTTLTSLDQFPGKSRWSEVIEMKDEDFGPLECAIKSMKAKNEDLERTLHKYYDHQDTSLNELEMLLAGTIGKNFLILIKPKDDTLPCKRQALAWQKEPKAWTQALQRYKQFFYQSGV